MKIQVLVGVAAVIAALFFFKVLSLDDLKKYQCRSKQSEAKSMLKEAQKRLTEHAAKSSGRVPNNWADLAWEPKTKRYDFVITDAGTNRFKVEARPKTHEMNGDVWTVDELATLSHVIDGCKAVRR